MKRYQTFFPIYSAALLLVFFSSLIFIPNVIAKKQTEKKSISKSKDYQSYLEFFESVFKVMEKNYYKDIRREDFNRFIKTFDNKIYKELKASGKSNDFVRWRSAAFLVDYLKQKEDIFSAFYPPKPAKEYEETVLGKRIDLGIEGEKIAAGFRVNFVEPRSDAYKKGLKANDLILEIDKQLIAELKEGEISELLKPFEKTKVAIEYLDGADRSRKSVNLLSMEYFKQTVFNVPIPIDNIYCLQIKRFNRKTSDDMFRFLKYMRQQGPIEGLIIDLRGNPGGPPLAAREIASFFLPAGDDFAYFQKKDKPKAKLDVPTIPAEYQYDGPITILIDNKSGSASELFSGILQKRKRAVLMGQNSAGQVFLKSMFHLDDESMLLLVTARGHHPDGHVFSFNGLVPDRFVTNEEDSLILKYAASYLVYMNQKSITEL